MKANIEVRVQMMEHGITQYDLAKELSVTPSWVSRLLRNSLSPKDQKRIMSAIDKLSKEGKQCHE